MNTRTQKVRRFSEELMFSSFEPRKIELRFMVSEVEPYEHRQR